MKLITPKELEDFVMQAAHEKLENYKCVETWKEADLEWLKPMAEMYMLMSMVKDPTACVLSAILSGFQLGRAFELKRIEIEKLEKMERL